jgi:hypothetical protein
VALTYPVGDEEDTSNDGGNDHGRPDKADDHGFAEGHGGDLPSTAGACSEAREFR